MTEVILYICDKTMNSIIHLYSVFLFYINLKISVYNIPIYINNKTQHFEG